MKAGSVPPIVHEKYAELCETNPNSPGISGENYKTNPRFW